MTTPFDPADPFGWNRPAPPPEVVTKAWLDWRASMVAPTDLPTGQVEREEQKDVLLALQSGRCAVCVYAGGDRLVLDHDHVTGLTRGLLCRSCNVREGMGRRNILFDLYRANPPAADFGWLYQDLYGEWAQPQEPRPTTQNAAAYALGKG